jgi:hypothetical protein
MSAAILTVGKLVFAVMGVAVGCKLAVSARGRGGLGLHTVALAAICSGGIGLLLMPLSGVLESWPLVVAAEAGVRGGMLLLCVFIAGTFRPSPAGWAGALLAGVLLVAAIVWDLRVQQPFEGYDYRLPSSHANQLSIAVPFLWATIESAVLWRRGRRRLELGLADPRIVQTYLVWCVATGCFVGICALAILAGLAESTGPSVVPGIAHAARGILYVVITLAIGLGLFGQRDASRSESPAP